MQTIISWTQRKGWFQSLSAMTKCSEFTLFQMITVTALKKGNTHIIIIIVEFNEESATEKT